MDIYAFPPVAALLDAASRGLLWLAASLEPVTGAASAAAAIVLVTLLVRAALIPVGISQARADQARARLAPRLRALRDRHGADRERLQRETMKLYADENVSPFAGCLPMLLQAPIVGVIYALFLHATVAGHPNPLLDHALGGASLGTSLVSALAHGPYDVAALGVPAAIVVLIAVVAKLTRRTLRPALAADAGESSGTAGGVVGGPWVQRTLGLLQFASAVFAAFVPLAASLYVAVTVTWTLAQRLILRRHYPLPG
ncbi:MAG: YidC/Oxa1 family membrane protein insertase [Microbacterium sp.]|uniref:YidC/Oxa1 family membrane protein insertase n=1 Tax=Microbacterium sp. TaxID=51671 RepID=UPI0039E58F50